MESFVLNLFSDQLSKVILDFNPNTINANLLSGKGSITNLRLNVDVINEFLNKPPHGLTGRLVVSSMEQLGVTSTRAAESIIKTRKDHNDYLK